MSAVTMSSPDGVHPTPRLLAHRTPFLEGLQLPAGAIASAVAAKSAVTTTASRTRFVNPPCFRGGLTTSDARKPSVAYRGSYFAEYKLIANAYDIQKLLEL